MKENSTSVYDMLSKHRSELMGIATLLVLFDHCWIRVFSDIPVLFEIEDFLKTQSGIFGVWIFVFLSGFGLPNSYKKNKLKDFYLARIERLFFPFIMATFFFSIVNKENFLVFLIQLTPITLFCKTYYPYLWFLPALILLYLLFPMYYSLYSKVNKKTLFTLSSITTWFIIAYLCKDINYQPTYRLIRIIPIFLLGIFANDRLKVMKFNRLAYIAQILLGIVFCKPLNCIYNRMNVGEIYGYVIESSLIVVGFCLLYSNKKKHLMKNAKIFIGKLSLEIYCFQTIIEKYITDILVNKFGVYITNIIFGFIVVIISF